MHKPKWCLFYDNHTMSMCPDVGANFDVERFTDRVKGCGVDFLTFHARCNQGMAYYDTKIGIKHPSLDYDLFGKLVEACKKKDIAISAYFNAGLSHDEGLIHRDWLRVSPHGEVYSGDDWSMPFYKVMCFNTGYGDHLVSMIKEVIENYPVDGLFIDGTSCPIGYPCIGSECIKEMKELGVNWQNEDELKEFGRQTAIKLMKRIHGAVMEKNPDLLVYFNNPGPETMSEFATYYECECLPTASTWGYEGLPIHSRYLRTLGKETILNMTGRFHIKWGDFGGIRTKARLEYDCIYGLANGMRPNVGGHFHQRGDINDAVFDLIEEVYKELQPYDSYFSDADVLTEIAVVSPFGEFRASGGEILKGVTRMLCELKQQFDIVSTFSSWDDYKVLIFPDEVIFNDEITKRVKKHLKSGGKIITSYHSGLDQSLSKFVLDDFGMEFIGEDPVDPPYVFFDDPLNAGLPNMPLCLYEPGTLVKTAGGSKVLAKVIDPYYNKGYDGEHAIYYTPPDKVTEKPAVVRNGNIIHFCHPVFLSYYKNGPLFLRQAFENALVDFLPEPLLKTEGMPSFSRATVTSLDKKRMVYLMAYLPEMRGLTTMMIEEPILMDKCKILLRLDGRKPEKVYLATDKNKELPFEISDGYIQVSVPQVKGYAIIVFEE